MMGKRAAKTKFAIATISMLAVFQIGIPALTAGQKVLTDVPDYLWHYGCTPTSGTMLAGFWDNQGYTNMIWGGANEADDANVLNPNGYANRNHYLNLIIDNYDHRNGNIVDNDYDTVSYNSMGGFMHTTIPGGSTSAWVGGTFDGSTGLRNFADYRSYHFGAVSMYATTSADYRAIACDWDRYKAIIDAGRPVMVSVPGHSTVGYGYLENYEGKDWWAVRDTWRNGTGSYEGMAAITYNGREYWEWGTASDQVKRIVDFAPMPSGNVHQESGDAGSTQAVAYDSSSEFVVIKGNMSDASDYDYYSLDIAEGQDVFIEYQAKTGATKDNDCEPYYRVYGPSGYIGSSAYAWCLRSFTTSEAGTYYIESKYGEGPTGAPPEEYLGGGNYQFVIRIGDPVPEPMVLPLLAIGGLVMLSRRRRRG